MNYHLTETGTGSWCVGQCDDAPHATAARRVWVEDGPQCETWVTVAPGGWVETWATAHAGDFEPGCVMPGRHGPSMVDGIIRAAIVAWAESL